MRWNSRDVWPHRAREGITALKTRDIPLPTPVTEALAVYDRIDGNEPTAPSHTAIREAITAGAPRKTLDGLLLADLGANRFRSEWHQARTDAAGAVLQAILESAEEIMGPLTKLAHDCIERLVKVSALGNTKLDDLVRAGRNDEAQQLANINKVAAELDSHFDFRDRFLTPGGPQALTVGGINASRWRDPVMASQHSRGANAAERYLNGLQNNVPLWFPSPVEAAALARELADAMDAEAARVKAQQHGVGSMAAFS